MSLQLLEARIAKVWAHLSKEEVHLWNEIQAACGTKGLSLKDLVYDPSKVTENEKKLAEQVWNVRFFV